MAQMVLLIFSISNFSKTDLERQILFSKNSIIGRLRFKKIQIGSEVHH